MNFDRKVIDAVLKQFSTLDAAYIHLQEFLDFELDSDDENMEESKDPVKNKSAAAAGQGNQMMG